jgi:hypothetical protein
MDEDPFLRLETDHHLMAILLMKEEIIDTRPHPDMVIILLQHHIEATMKGIDLVHHPKIMMAATFVTIEIDSDHLQYENTQEILGEEVEAIGEAVVVKFPILDV